MIRSGKIGLRARQPSDVPVLHAELHDDVATQTRSSGRPWRPIPPDPERSPFGVGGADDDTVDRFSVVELAGGELAGGAVLWGQDAHNRSAHLGLTLRPDFRGRGLAGDVVRALCAYGFGVRGLHRLQVDTLTDNIAMIKAAQAAGFVVEGTLRGADWVYGAFADEMVLGLLATEWQPQPLS